MQQRFAKAVGKGVTIFANDMVRISRKFKFDVVQHIVDLSIGVTGFA